MMVMILKSFLIVCPMTSEKGKSCLTYQKRASYFSLIEHFSQFYLSLLTIRPWIHVLLDAHNSSFLFSSFLLFFYSIVKLYHLYRSLAQLRRSVKEAFQTLTFPLASVNDLRDNLCPVCQSEYKIQLF
jgi:hypothetical protein